MTVTILRNNPRLARDKFELTLDGRRYLLRFRWMERQASWYMSVYTVAGTPIRTGVRVVVNFPLLSRSGSALLPDGILLGVDVSQAGAEIVAQSELGDRVQLVFTPAADLPGPNPGQSLRVEVL